MMCSRRTIKSAPERLYQAFTDPAELAAWLPPGNMAGRIHRFDLREGGGYSMSLFYPPDEKETRGKIAADEDRVEVRFVELSYPHRIVEAVRFVTTDPALFGEMRMTISLVPMTDGMDVVMLFEDLPAGLQPEDNAEGARLSLEQPDGHVATSQTN